jgi:NAD(P)-dependent dehydrogenase (short-subunit alcohol dehydrogenase family)
MFSLQDKAAFITGAAGGIGFAVAQRFTEAGARVAIADIVDGSFAAEEIGAHYLSIDVSSEDSVRQAIEQASELVGTLDIVVNNAGIGDVGPTLEESPQALVERMTAINQWGVLYGLKHSPGHMNDGGSIINTSSLAAIISIPGNGVYSAAKRAILSYTEMAALELGHRGIRVNAVCPGYVETALGSAEEGDALCGAFTALGRKATTDDVVGVYHFLAADESSYITGQAINVDGGWSCGPTSALLERVIGSGQVS